MKSILLMSLTLLVPAWAVAAPQDVTINVVNTITSTHPIHYAVEVGTAMSPRLDLNQGSNTLSFSQSNVIKGPDAAHPRIYFMDFYTYFTKNSQGASLPPNEIGYATTGVTLGGDNLSQHCFYNQNNIVLINADNPPKTIKITGRNRGWVGDGLTMVCQ